MKTMVYMVSKLCNYAETLENKGFTQGFGLETSSLKEFTECVNLGRPRFQMVYVADPC